MLDQPSGDVSMGMETGGRWWCSACGPAVLQRRSGWTCASAVRPDTWPVGPRAPRAREADERREAWCAVRGGSQRCERSEKQHAPLGPPLLSFVPAAQAQFSIQNSFSTTTDLTVLLTVNSIIITLVKLLDTRPNSSYFSYKLSTFLLRSVFLLIEIDNGTFLLSHIKILSLDIN